MRYSLAWIENRGACDCYRYLLPYGVFDHVGYKPSEKGGANLEAGVGVDLNQVDPELVIYHEVQAEDL